MELNERRAQFVYDGARLAATASEAPIVPVAWIEREVAFKDQFLEVIERQCGDQRLLFNGRRRQRKPFIVSGRRRNAFENEPWKTRSWQLRESRTAVTCRRSIGRALRPGTR